MADDVDIEGSVDDSTALIRSADVIIVGCSVPADCVATAVSETGISWLAASCDGDDVSPDIAPECAEDSAVSDVLPVVCVTPGLCTVSMAGDDSVEPFDATDAVDRSASPESLVPAVRRSFVADAVTVDSGPAAFLVSETLAFE